MSDNPARRFTVKDMLEHLQFLEGMQAKYARQSIESHEDREIWAARANHKNVTNIIAIVKQAASDLQSLPTRSDILCTIGFFEKIDAALTFDEIAQLADALVGVGVQVRHE